MTWPSPGKNVTVPFWYSGLGGTPTQGQSVAGNVTVDTITDLEWGQVETEWTLRVNCNPPPPPDGGLWFGPAFEFKAFRFRVSDSTWVGAPFASMSNRTASWDFAASSGGTGGFYVQFPVSQNGVTGVFTYSTGVNVYYLWADDVLPPGVDEANPVRFTAKPMASAKGALQTVIAPDFLDLMLGEWNQHGDPLKVAALTAGQDSTDGTWDESLLAEVDTDGYERGSLPLANLPAADYQARWNQVGITFGTNTTGAATVVTHLAVLNSAGTTVLTLVELSNPVTTATNQQIVIPTAGLRLTAQ